MSSSINALGKSLQNDVVSRAMELLETDFAAFLQEYDEDSDRLIERLSDEETAKKFVMYPKQLKQRFLERLIAEFH